MKLNKLLLILSVVFFTEMLFAQRSGVIIYERKTNLKKRFKDPNMQNFLTEENKYKYDFFELKFNDTSAVMLPVENPNESDQMEWATIKHNTQITLNDGKMRRTAEIAGLNLTIEDTFKAPKWKITGIKREIADYSCFKAFYHKNDSVTLYAWFSPELPVAVGPEGYSGLPGTILGLATEDGGEIYFANEVKLRPVTKKEITFEFNKSKAKTEEETLITLKEQFKDNQMMMDYMFMLFGL